MSDLVTKSQSVKRTRGTKPTEEEAKAILTLVRGGWLKLELTIGDPDCPVCDDPLGGINAVMAGRKHNHA